MHEARKLDETAYFLDRMVALQNARQELVWNLSAFLTAARTVAQYAREEATPKPGGQAWYDAAVAMHRSIKFFRCKRNLNIHLEPVEPQRGRCHAGDRLSERECVGRTSGWCSDGSGPDHVERW